jgi:Ni,Fe-hydrogenase III large subunit
MGDKFLKIGNGEKINTEKIPDICFNEFYEEMLRLALDGYNIVHYFAYKDNLKTRLVAILRKQNFLYIASAIAPDKYESLTVKCAKFHNFERELAEEYAIKPINHPWLKSLRYHPNFSGKSDIFGNDYSEDIPGKYEFYSITGEEVHEIAVGPVHAGIIEPGHFRFNCAGEKVLHLEIQLGYQHRGVEKQILNTRGSKLPVLIESVAGDTSVANSLSFSMAVENLANIAVNKELEKIRGIALELERIANHIGDLGALSGDIAFLPAAAYYGRIRGEFLNIFLEICGNRFGKGFIRPGGARFIISDNQRILFLSKLKILRKEIIEVAEMLFNNAGVLSRFESTGAVNTDIANDLGLVGPVARASNISYDVRYDLPAGIYRDISIRVVNEKNCDVMSRALVRYKEVLASLDIIENLLESLEDTKPYKNIEYYLDPDSLVVTLQEAWRGELSHCVITDSNGDILRYKIKDPSFNNWIGLAVAMRDEEISDFPLCNKSFNLSYCGHDL